MKVFNCQYINCLQFASCEVNNPNSQDEFFKLRTTGSSDKHSSKT